MHETAVARPFVSMIKIDGIPIPIPPVITSEDSKQIEEWRKQAIIIEEKLYIRRQQVSSSQQKARLQSSKIGAIPARSANFEERPQSRSIASGEQVVRKALTSAAYNEEKALAGLMQKVNLDEARERTNDKSISENEEQVASESLASAPIPSATSTDLEPYLSNSTSTSSQESTGTVRPETFSTESSEGQDQDVQVKFSRPRSSYTIENPSSALVESNQDRSSPTKPHFGHLGSMVAKILTEQQRAKNLSEYAKLQSILQDSDGVAKDMTEPSPELSPTKRLQNVPESVSGSFNVAGMKRRRGVDSKASASDRLIAHVRGFLVRRVMQTQKVQHWIQTIRDCQSLLRPEQPSSGLDWRSLTDSRFKEQVESQLMAALEQFHAIMFDWPLTDRLALIAMERAPRGHSAMGRPVSRNNRSSPGAARGRSYSASSLQPSPHANTKQPSHAAVADHTKRRRIGATTPPKVGPNLHATRIVTSRPQNSRPSTASGQSGITSQVRSNVTGAISPRNGSSRPSTAAPNIPETRAHTRRNVAELGHIQPTPPSTSAVTSRRSSFGANLRR